MMATVGWADLMEDAQKMFDTYNSLSGVNDELTLRIRKGQLDILNWLLTLKEVSEKSYEELNEKIV